MKPEELRKRRLGADLTIAELAKRAGVSEDTVSKIENGHRKGSPLTIARLEKVLSGRDLLEAAQYAERYLTEHPPPDAGPLYQITLEVLRTAIRRNQ